MKFSTVIYLWAGALLAVAALIFQLYIMFTGG
jgi:hypothetical protein